MRRDIDAIIERVWRSLATRTTDDLTLICMRTRQASRRAQNRGRHDVSMHLDMVWTLADRTLFARMGR